MNELPSSPRPLTHAARRRSWAEMPVRIWLVLTITLTVVIAFFTISQIAAGAGERAMILHGTPVDATIVQLSGTTNTNAAFHRNEPLSAKVRYTLPDETSPRINSGYLSAVDISSVLHVGDSIPIRLDPSDANQWTDRTQPRSWFVELSVALLLLPVLALLLLVTFLQRARMLRIWRDGDQAQATVMEIRHTAIAPMSRLLRLTLSDGSSARLFSVLVPTRAEVPSPGETVWLVMPRGVPERAVLAKLYL